MLQIVIVMVSQIVSLQIGKTAGLESEITYSARRELQLGKQAKWLKVNL
jgi:hypothetical protein